MSRTALWALIPLLGLGCTYSAQFRAPEGIQTIAVEIFQNRTLYTEVEYDLHRALRREIRMKTPLTLGSPLAADAVLTGQIIDYRRYVLRESQTDQPTEYRVVIVVSYDLTNRRTGGVIASSKRLRRGADYQLRQGQVERQAREEAIRELARNLVQHAFRQWD